MLGTGQGRRTTLLGPVVALALLFLAWSASSGPVPLIGGSYDGIESTPREQESLQNQGPDPIEAAKDAVVQTRDLGVIGDTLAWIVLGVLLAGVGALLVWGWRHRWRPAPRPTEVAFDVLPSEENRAAAALRDESDALLESLTDGEPRNAIVQCWLRLEEMIGGSGLPRRRHETSTEYVVRVLHSLDLDPRAVGALASLHREARFSEHDLGEESREAAVEALERLQAQLRDLGRVR